VPGQHRLGPLPPSGVARRDNVCRVRIVFFAKRQTSGAASRSNMRRGPRSAPGNSVLAINKHRTERLARRQDRPHDHARARVRRLRAGTSCSSFTFDGRPGKTSSSSAGRGGGATATFFDDCPFELDEADPPHGPGERCLLHQQPRPGSRCTPRRAVRARLRDGRHRPDRPRPASLPRSAFAADVSFIGKVRRARRPRRPREGARAPVQGAGFYGQGLGRRAGPRSRPEEDVFPEQYRAICGELEGHARDRPLRDDRSSFYFSNRTWNHARLAAASLCTRLRPPGSRRSSGTASTSRTTARSRRRPSRDRALPPGRRAPPEDPGPRGHRYAHRELLLRGKNGPSA